MIGWYINKIVKLTMYIIKLTDRFDLLVTILPMAAVATAATTT